jgi:hypothetical protein
MLNVVFAKRSYARRANCKITSNNYTQDQSKKGYYPTGFYHLQASLTLSHHSLTTLGKPEWQSTSCQIKIYVKTSYQLHHHMNILSMKNQQTPSTLISPVPLI